MKGTDPAWAMHELEDKLRVFLRERRQTDDTACALLSVLERTRPPLVDFVMLAITSYADSAAQFRAIAEQAVDRAPIGPVYLDNPRPGDVVSVKAHRIGPSIGLEAPEVQEVWVPARVEAVEGGLLFTHTNVAGERRRNPPLKLSERGKLWR